MTRAASREMLLKIQLKREANERERRDAAQERESDPLERAKTYLRQRGWHVFAENVLPGCFRSKRIVVGTRRLEVDEVIAMAERVRERLA